MKNSRRIYCTILLLFQAIYPAQSQDLENVSKETLFDINGGIRTNHVFYSGKGMEQRRDPYQYIFAANLNLKLLVWEMPLSFTYTNKQGKLQHSLNQLSIRPTYKWLTLYLGKTSMNFSPYTMSGHLFEGIGADVKPEGKLEASAFYGRMQKARVLDTLTDPAVDPAFKRMAWGVRGMYKPDDGNVEIIVFHSADDHESLTPIESESLIAENNMVVSVRAEQKLLGCIQVRGEAAASQLSYHSNEFETLSRGVEVKKEEQYTAWNGGVDYLHEAFTIGLGYERVDPGYRTHGAYYFTNDLENVTLNVTTGLWDQKIRISANTGLQHDNLDDDKMSKMRRFVGDANLSFQPGDVWNASVSYSNFRSYTRMWKSYEDYQITQPYEDLDTLNYIQISQNINGQAVYHLGNGEDNNHQLTTFASYQVSDNLQGEETSNRSRFINANVMYRYHSTPLGLSISPGLSGYGSNAMEMNSLTAGPVLSVTKASTSKKLRTSVSMNYNNTYVNNKKENIIIVTRFINRYTLQKKHRFSLVMVFLNKRHLTEEVKTSELTLTFNYAYQFGK